jgi:hypothetical protein
MLTIYKDNKDNKVKFTLNKITDENTIIKVYNVNKFNSVHDINKEIDLINKGKIYCDCGHYITLTNKYQHLKSKKHLNYLESEIFHKNDL